MKTKQKLKTKKPKKSLKKIRIARRHAMSMPREVTVSVEKEGEADGE